MSTQLQQRVWDALNEIPKGKVTTYGDIAKHLKTKAVRAVGTAVGKNPNAPQCPCHRVVRADGKIGNYSGKGGVNGKIKLLKKEGVMVEDGAVNLARFGFNFVKKKQRADR